MDSGQIIIMVSKRPLYLWPAPINQKTDNQQVRPSADPTQISADGSRTRPACCRFQASANDDCAEVGSIGSILPPPLNMVVWQGGALHEK